MCTALLCNIINFNNSIPFYVYITRYDDLVRRLMEKFVISYKEIWDKSLLHESFTNGINHCRLLFKFSSSRLSFAANIANMPQFS